MWCKIEHGSSSFSRGSVESVRHELDVKGMFGQIHKVQFSTDATLIFAGCASGLAGWRTDDGSLIFAKNMSGNKHAITCNGRILHCLRRVMQTRNHRVEVCHRLEVWDLDSSRVCDLDSEDSDSKDSHQGGMAAMSLPCFSGAGFVEVLRITLHLSHDPAIVEHMQELDVIHNAMKEGHPLLCKFRG